MFFNKVKCALQLASGKFQREGFVPMLKSLKDDALRFFGSYLFYYAEYYLYELTLQERNEADFLPTVPNFTVQIVSSNRQADMLAAEGDDFRKYFYSARQALDKGAIAFCIFVEGELAHVTWAAFTEEAKNTFDAMPYRINFAEKEAYTGGTFTFPKFRGKGLMTYSSFKKYQFLREQGVKISRNSVKVNNVASLRVHSKFAPKIYAKVRYVRFLWWKFVVNQRGY
jgi:hypothetical protein